MAVSTRAASATVRAIGPAVSWVWLIGTMPARLTRPTVGLMPTMPLTEDGQMIDPSVSVPMATVTKPAATAAAGPELEPQALRREHVGVAGQAAAPRSSRWWNASSGNWPIR